MCIIINYFFLFLITIALIVVLCHGKIAHKYQTEYTTLVILYGTAMTTFYQALAAARVSDSNWQPSIFVGIPPPQCVSDAIISCTDI